MHVGNRNLNIVEHAAEQSRRERVVIALRCERALQFLEEIAQLAAARSQLGLLFIPRPRLLLLWSPAVFIQRRGQDVDAAQIERHRQASKLVPRHDHLEPIDATGEHVHRHDADERILTEAEVFEHDAAAPYF